MHGLKLDAAALFFVVGAGADAQPASSAATPIVARPPNSRLREVSLKVSSKMLPSGKRWGLVVYTLANDGNLGWPHGTAVAEPSPSGDSSEMFRKCKTAPVVRRKDQKCAERDARTGKRHQKHHRSLLGSTRVS